jgi:alkylation response protein AidB-like acyl-CoA dehydrogenase
MVGSRHDKPPAGDPVGSAALGDLQAALERIAAQADELDREPAFPHDAFRALAAAGALGATLPAGDGERIRFADELGVIERVSRADGSVGRILDGHFNALDRVCLLRPDLLGDEERAAIAAGKLLFGVWGADPAPGEGEPACVRDEAGELTLHGVKTFCSGAGGVQRALVVVRDQAGASRLAYVDLSRNVAIDRSWYRGAGLRASESHRVLFGGAPVLALLGGPGELLREPWFSRDAIRTTATWAGIAAGIVEAALTLLRQRGDPSETVALTAGRMLVAQGTIERWLAYAAERAQDEAALTGTAIQARWASAAAARQIATDAALACGSRPLATGGALSRGRRDLDLFLLQHRLEPLLARHGADALTAEGAR